MTTLSLQPSAAWPFPWEVLKRNPMLQLAGSVSLAVLLFVSLASPVRVDTPHLAETTATVLTPQAIVTNPQRLLPLTPEQAVAVNAAIPVTAEPGAAPSPLRLAVNSPVFDRAIDCLTSAVYYEAASEPDAGQRAVAQVVLNRVRHPAWPNTVCGVVFQGHERRTGCQFSFTCDGSLRRVPSVAGWRRAKRVAQAALAGEVFRGVGNATHYHANYVVPYWASSLDKSAVIGAHIFYRWRGSWGQPSAFRQRHSGYEPSIRPSTADQASAQVTEQPELTLTADTSADMGLKEDGTAQTQLATPRVTTLAADQAVGTLLVSGGKDSDTEVPARRRDRCRSTRTMMNASQERAGPMRPIGVSSSSREDPCRQA